jgi:hypothetical protein
VPSEEVLTCLLAKEECSDCDGDIPNDHCHDHMKEDNDRNGTIASSVSDTVEHTSDGCGASLELQWDDGATK